MHDSDTSRSVSKTLKVRGADPPPPPHPPPLGYACRGQWTLFQKELVLLQDLVNWINR